MSGGLFGPEKLDATLDAMAVLTPHGATYGIGMGSTGPAADSGEAPMSSEPSCGMPDTDAGTPGTDITGHRESHASVSRHTVKHSGPIQCLDAGWRLLYNPTPRRSDRYDNARPEFLPRSAAWLVSIFCIVIPDRGVPDDP
jgi:hypothetical protein